MDTLTIIRELRKIAEVGIINHLRDVPVIIAAADRLEELDERVAIMEEGNNLV